MGNEYGHEMPQGPDKLLELDKYGNRIEFYSSSCFLFFFLLNTYLPFGSKNNVVWILLYHVSSFHAFFIVGSADHVDVFICYVFKVVKILNYGPLM